MSSHLMQHGLFDSYLVVHNDGCNHNISSPASLEAPTLNWDGNLHENFKSFCIHGTVLLEGLYSRYGHKDKVATLLLWMGNKGFYLYNSIE